MGIDTTFEPEEFDEFGHFRSLTNKLKSKALELESRDLNGDEELLFQGACFAVLKLNELLSEREGRTH